MAQRSVTCYISPNKPNSAVMCAAFAEGATPEGWLSRSNKLSGKLDHAAAFYGVTDYNKQILHDCRELGLPFFYMDNGYFSHKMTPAKEKYFRVTKNRLQHTGIGSGSVERFRKHRVEIEPWKKDGKHILVCPPREFFMRTVLDMCHDKWLEDTLAGIKQHTDRPIEIKYKPTKAKYNFGDSLKDVFAVVTCLSNTAVESLCAGVPVFVHPDSAAFPMASGSLDNIERPNYPEGREAWASVLSSNQWTMEEIRDGTCWKAVA